MSALREYWRVLRLHARMQLGLSALGARARGGRPGKNTLRAVGFGLLMLYAVGAVLFIYGAVLFPLMRAASVLNMHTFIMGGIVLLCMTVVLFFGTMTILSLVFGAKDAETFAALPLRGQSVFLAKFTMAYAIETGMTAVFLWPAVVIYGIVSKLSAPEFLLLILRALPVWLLLPAVPMAAAALLSMVFTRLSALARHRDKLLMVFGILLTLGLVIGQSLLTGRLAPALSDQAKVEELLVNSGAWLGAVSRAFPPAGWCAQALIGTNAASAAFGYLGLAAAAAAGLAVCVLLSRHLYYKGVLAQLEAPKGKKKGFRQTGVKAGSPLRAYVVKELRLIVRSPVYALNILMGLLVVPLMVVIALSVDPSGMGASAGTEGLRAILSSLFGGSSGDAYYLLAAGVVMVTGIVGATGVSTSFSREGAMLWISQTVPVTAETQVAARLLGGFILVFIGGLLTLLALAFFVGLSAAQVIFGLVAGSCSVFPLLAVSLIPDALRPKRRWNSEAEAMKQNANSLLAMLLGFGLAFAIGILAFFLQTVIQAWAAGAAAAVVCLGVGYLIYRYDVRLVKTMMRTVDG
ncbi:MAG: hypothetical protein LBR76_00600 [Oscillospiraceae bacterium]|jgi:ABC-2 type transport system permease protein|nr:hypothetical protein [Oscillospiraceae bacterium]